MERAKFRTRREETAAPLNRVQNQRLKNNDMNSKTSTLKVKTKIRAGGVYLNHNATLVRCLKVKTNVKAGGIWQNHNETLVRG